MSERILILGGTKEAAELATLLTAEGHDVTTSLAGRTKEPKPLDGKVRTGGFGGVDGLVGWIEDYKIDRLIDATHPFAQNISKNAQAAAQKTNVTFVVKQRLPWQRQNGDNWIDVADLAAAKNIIPQNARVLLALGSQHIKNFAEREDVHFLIRMIDPPTEHLPFKIHTLVFQRPSPDWKLEADMLKEHKISHIVCRNSGGPGAYAKIEAARNLRIPVIMIDRSVP